MNPILSLSLAAIIMVIAANAELGRFQSMRDQLQKFRATPKPSVDNNKQQTTFSPPKFEHKFMMPSMPHLPVFQPHHVPAPVVPHSGHSAMAAGNGNSVTSAASGPAGVASASTFGHPNRFKSAPHLNQASMAAANPHGATASVTSSLPRGVRHFPGRRFGTGPRFVTAQASSNGPGVVASAKSSALDNHEHHELPRVVNEAHAQTGTFSDNTNGLKTSAYVRKADSEHVNESGAKEDDHHQKSKSYGSNHEENHNVDYDKDEEEIDHRPDRFIKKKVKETYKGNHNVSRQKTGTESMARNKFRASFSNDYGRTKEHVKRNEHLEGDGVLQDTSSSEHREVEEENEDVADSRGGKKGFEFMPTPPPVPMMATASANDHGATASAARAARR